MKFTLIVESLCKLCGPWGLPSISAIAELIFEIQFKNVICIPALIYIFQKLKDDVSSNNTVWDFTIHFSDLKNKPKSPWQLR